MAIGIVTDDDFEKELGKFKPPSSSQAIVIEPDKNGRPLGKKEVPEPIRKLIATNAIEGVPHKELQSLFDVSQSSVSAYQNGSTSLNTPKKPDRDLRNHVKKVRANISKRARGKLKLALENMTEDKFEEAPLPVLSRVASDMAGIIEKMEEKLADDKPSVQFVLFAPRVEKEESYQIVDADD